MFVINFLLLPTLMANPIRQDLTDKKEKADESSIVTPDFAVNLFLYIETIQYHHILIELHLILASHFDKQNYIIE